MTAAGRSLWRGKRRKMTLCLRSRAAQHLSASVKAVISSAPLGKACKQAQAAGTQQQHRRGYTQQVARLVRLQVPS